MSKGGIKNWTITAQSVAKGAGVRENYFHNLKHSNHKQTERTIDVHGSFKTTANIIRNCEAYKLSKQKRGGRPPTDAMEFVLTLPKGIRPSVEQWRKILGGVMRDVAEKLDVSTKDLAPISRAVVHQQNQEQRIKGAGDHMHLMIGKFTNDQKYMRDLQKKGVLHTMKSSFNVQVLNVLGLDHRTYISKRKYAGEAKKRAPQWVVKAAREREANDKRLELLRDAEARFNDETRAVLADWMHDIERWLDAKRQHDDVLAETLFTSLQSTTGSLTDIAEPEQLNSAQAVVDQLNQGQPEKIPDLVSRALFRRSVDDLV